MSLYEGAFFIAKVNYLFATFTVLFTTGYGPEYVAKLWYTTGYENKYKGVKEEKLQAVLYGRPLEGQSVVWLLAKFKR